MPIYEYRCQECEHEFDVLQKMADDPLLNCPACGEPALVKLISAPSFRLSGTGWYETDFKTDNDKKKNLKDSADKKTATASDKDSSAGAKTESKADKKPADSASGTKKDSAKSTSASSTNA